ncbi:MAG: hypothetical protein M1405_00900 [Patescibacteria group bacterium]|nr:hypothetical protein [Patescibacteria group bacterium]
MGNKEIKGATVRFFSEGEVTEAFMGPFRPVAKGDMPDPSHVIDGTIPTRLYGRQPGQAIIALPAESMPQGAIHNPRPRLH